MKIDTTNQNDLKYIEETKINHSDEKWYYLQELKKRVKIFAGEPEIPADQVQSKSNRTQVMVTTVLSQPTSNFDGKVCLQIHTNDVVAQRNSINRPAGTIEKKTLISKQTTLMVSFNQLTF